MVEAHFGLRGSGLVRFMIISVACPAFTLLGYNNAVFGGLLDLDSFVATFPQIDTVNATGAQKANNAEFRVCTFAHPRNVSSAYRIKRNRRGTIHCRLHVRRSFLYQTG